MAQPTSPSIPLVWLGLDPIPSVIAPILSHVGDCADTLNRNWNHSAVQPSGDCGFLGLRALARQR